MKTTIEIRDDLFYFAKEEALRRRTTFRAVIETELEKLVEEKKEINAPLKEQRGEYNKPYEINELGIPVITSELTEEGKEFFKRMNEEGTGTLLAELEMEDYLEKEKSIREDNNVSS